MDSPSLGRGTAWVGVASGLSGVLDVVTTVTCLWLWLSPADLGTATLAGAMLPVLERLAGLGMPAALVRFGDRDRRAQSTMLWIHVASALAVLAGVIGAGPAIAGVFGEPIIASLLVGYGVKLALATVHAVPEAQLRRALRFESLTRVRIAAAFADAATKLVVAYLGGHGHPELRIWCFVLGPLAGGIVTSIGIQLYWPWRPALAFDRTLAAAALRYGTQVSGGELLYFIYTNADYLVIGRMWGDAAVGGYRLAYELVLDVVRLISLVTAEVAFPAFARLAADRRRAGELLVRFTRQNAIAVVPVVVFLAVAADDLLAVLYPPLPPAATTAARILCVVGALRMLSFVLPAMLAGLGHASDALRYHALAALLLPTVFALFAWAMPDLGYVAVAWAWAAAYPLVFFVLLGRALARCHVTLTVYLHSLAGIAACGGLAAIAAWVVHAAAPLPPLARLLVVAAAILAIYLVALSRVEHITPRSILRTIRSSD
ncbi:MAG TPA: oligosaccharide flippase family protein [Kofleriaceae bacterium]|nr:oligosaccharide flippase family protein [Kofleriaceae bacterium]